ncbi:MAG: hypothetical protein H8K06_06940 [Nitrospira sp.]|uniref:Lipoprotein n=1 Tax=Nitrospira defluvii TaxID=330214 RepID=A0ABN7KI92_9BACT|nr:hypothetical protein [Nitrospira defluvii]MCS6326807.1 hypothetical protein [Nitrospira sp.]CAE6694622.1 conserved hypothetical protein [Nitrospira defluvii]
MALVAALLFSSGCQYFSPRSNVPTHYNLPLTVYVRLDPSIRAGAVDYRDACGQTVSLPIHDTLEAELKRRMAQVFERVTIEPGPAADASDGVIDVALGLRQVELFIPRKGNKTYPASVTLGLDFAYTDRQGAVLHAKKLQSVITGEVEVRAETCNISGLEQVAQQTIARVVEGMAEQLGTATKIREQAQWRNSRPAGPIPTAGQPALPVSPLQNPAPMPPTATAVTEATQPAAAVAPSKPTHLSFRTILRDHNQNQVLEQNETFSVEFEVKNEGEAAAEGVAVDLKGHAAIVSGVTTPVPLGLLQPGEIRRVTVDGKVGTVSDAEQAELICALQAAPNVSLPAPKKFFVAIRPDAGGNVEVLSVDVDQLPSKNGKAVQPQAVGIAIGVGTFRDRAVPPMMLAAHDAEVMGGYFKSVLGLPPQKVKVALDAKGLKDDWIEIFEQWLPKHAGPSTTAYVYVAGRAVVDSETGAVAMLPYDATVSGQTRTFSLARLQRALANAPVKQAVVMLELSLEPSAGSDPGRIVPPRWLPHDAGGEQDRVMLMVGNAAVQEAQAYQPGQHGLFTYFLLKGMRGAADLDKNGTVLTGELCAYVHGQVGAIAHTQSGAIQETLCLPAAGDRSPLRGIVVSRPQ